MSWLKKHPKKVVDTFEVEELARFHEVLVLLELDLEVRIGLELEELAVARTFTLKPGVACRVSSIEFM